MVTWFIVSTSIPSEQSTIASYFRHTLQQMPFYITNGSNLKLWQYHQGAEIVLLSFFMTYFYCVFKDTKHVNGM